MTNTKSTVSSLAAWFMAILTSMIFALTAFAPANAQEAFNPIGRWEAGNKESRYEIMVCGENDQMLCAYLYWIQEDKKDSRNTKYLNSYIFTHAKQVKPNVWQGSVKMEGFSFGGTLTQTSNARMELNACVLFVICENQVLNRIK